MNSHCIYLIFCYLLFNEVTDVDLSDIFVDDKGNFKLRVAPRYTGFLVRMAMPYSTLQYNVLIYYLHCYT